MHVSFIQQGLQIHGIYFLCPFIQSQLHEKIDKARHKTLLERWRKEGGYAGKFHLHGRSEIETKQKGFCLNRWASLPCGLYSQFPSEAFHMNEVAGHTVKVGQGEVKSCNQL